MENQKFNKWDYVRIDNDLGDSMSHFKSGCNAIVIGSYADQFGGSNTKSYTLYVKGHGECSWYYENQLTLIEKDRIDILQKWENKATIDKKLKSNLDWIFKNGKDVLENEYEASIQALANCFGLTNLWGSHGEGFVWQQNAMMTLLFAHDYLISGDKEGWLNKADEIKSRFK